MIKITNSNILPAKAIPDLWLSDENNKWSTNWLSDLNMFFIRKHQLLENEQESLALMIQNIENKLLKQSSSIDKQWKVSKLSWVVKLLNCFCFKFWVASNIFHMMHSTMIDMTCRSMERGGIWLGWMWGVGLKKVF